MFIIRFIKSVIALAILIGIFYFYNKIGKTQTGSPIVDADLQQYVNEWKSDMEKSGIDWAEPYSRIKRIYFYNNSDDRLGYSTYNTNEVWVSKRLLRRDPYLLRASLYHELGHFVFQLDHSSGIMSDKSLDKKNPVYYENNWNNILQEYLEECKASKANIF